MGLGDMCVYGEVGEWRQGAGAVWHMEERRV